MQRKSVFPDTKSGCVSFLTNFIPCFTLIGTREGGGGHSITKHTGRGGLARRSESKTSKYLSKNSNI